MATKDFQGATSVISEFMDFSHWGLVAILIGGRTTGPLFVRGHPLRK